MADWANSQVYMPIYPCLFYDLYDSTLQTQHAAAVFLKEIVRLYKYKQSWISSSQNGGNSVVGYAVLHTGLYYRGGKFSFPKIWNSPRVGYTKKIQIYVRHCIAA